jgi:hypothetical protein
MRWGASGITGNRAEASRSTSYGPAAVGAFGALLLLLPFSRLDFDEHHDGYMVAQAIAVSEGLVAHSEVFAQYGPVAPWVQSLLVALPVGPVLAIRLGNAAFIALTVFLVADFGRVAPISWRISKRAAWLASATWLVLADVWFGVRMLPWSSVIVAFLVMGGLYAIAQSSSASSQSRIARSRCWAVAAGMLLGLAPFTRINVGLAAVFVAIVVLAAAWILFRDVWATTAFACVVTLLATIGSLVAWMALNSSLDDFIQQAIIGPLTWGSGATADWQTSANLRRIFVEQLAPTLVIGAATITAFFTRRGRFHRAPDWLRANRGAILAGVFVTLWQLRLGLPVLGDILRGRPVTLQELRYAVVDTYNEFLAFFMVVAVVSSLAVCIVGVIWLCRARLSPEFGGWLLMAGLGLALLTQMVPTWDSRHLWWGLPIGLLVAFSVTDTLTGARTTLGLPLAVPVTVVAVAAVVTAVAYLTFPRVDAPPESIARGMRMTSAESQILADDQAFLLEQLGLDGTAVFLVDQGHFSVIGGRFASQDRFFVAWGGPPPLPTRLAEGVPVVVEKGLATRDEVEQQLGILRYELSGQNERLAVFTRPG